MAKARGGGNLERLLALVGRPAEQVALAIDLLGREKSLPVVEAALAVLVERPDPAARRVLLDRFAHFGGDGLKQDLGGHLRTACLKALRHLALAEDVPLLERAAFTYEFTYYGEAASGMRSSALVALNEVEPERAAYFAARLLADLHTHPMSGEPAVSAIRLLAAGGHLVPVYAHALAEPKEYDEPDRDPAVPPGVRESMPPVGVPEVVAECLRHLRELPDSLLGTVAARHGATGNDVVALGLIDLLVDHRAGAAHAGPLSVFLRWRRRYDVHRYLLTVLVARRRDDLLVPLAPVLSAESDARTRDLAREALAIRQGDPMFDGLAGSLGLT